jgi:hypothetical protein
VSTLEVPQAGKDSRGSFQLLEPKIHVIEILKFKKRFQHQARWSVPVIPALGRQKQEDQGCKASLGYTETPVSKKKVEVPKDW